MGYKKQWDWIQHCMDTCAILRSSTCKRFGMLDQTFILLIMHVSEPRWPTMVFLLRNFEAEIKLFWEFVGNVGFYFFQLLLLQGKAVEVNKRNPRLSNLVPFMRPSRVEHGCSSPPLWQSWLAKKVLLQRSSTNSNCLRVNVWVHVPMWHPGPYGLAAAIGWEPSQCTNNSVGLKYLQYFLCRLPLHLFSFRMKITVVDIPMKTCQGI